LFAKMNVGGVQPRFSIFESKVSKIVSN
jgi:hypothetical protein